MKIYLPATIFVLLSCLLSPMVPPEVPTREAFRVHRDHAGSEPAANALWPAVRHTSTFQEIATMARTSSCEDSNPPQELATPDPVLEPANDDFKMTVSFVVGRDGTVKSPLILQGSDDDAGREVINTIRSWRYRPAICNGVPAEFEAKVEFSRRANRF